MIGAGQENTRLTDPGLKVRMHFSRATCQGIVLFARGAIETVNVGQPVIQHRGGGGRIDSNSGITGCLVFNSHSRSRLSDSRYMADGCGAGFRPLIHVSVRRSINDCVIRISDLVLANSSSRRSLQNALLQNGCIQPLLRLRDSLRRCHLQESSTVTRAGRREDSSRFPPPPPRLPRPGLLPGSPNVAMQIEPRPGAFAGQNRKGRAQQFLPRSLVGQRAQRLPISGLGPTAKPGAGVQVPACASRPAASRHIQVRHGGDLGSFLKQKLRALDNQRVGIGHSAQLAPRRKFCAAACPDGSFHPGSACIVPSPSCCCLPAPALRHLAGIGLGLAPLVEQRFHA
jgi:hypothetical protein